jgi:hypothetical protein
MAHRPNSRFSQMERPAHSHVVRQWHLVATDSFDADINSIQSHVQTMTLPLSAVRINAARTCRQARSEWGQSLASVLASKYARSTKAA